MLCTSSKRTWQSPSNAHAYRLYIFKDLQENLFSCRPAVISEALNSSTAFAALKRLAFSFHFEGINLVVAASEGKRKRPVTRLGVCCCKSLTMTYFHTGTRTIIGAKSFHCPVRDGKEWCQLAMVIRHNFLLQRSVCRTLQRIHRD